ncbi:MAG: trimethylamine methyltransferase family protein [Victivallales bacterium]|nr:trimethylamine methyltransferase family protein [Victivallales bacterium]
MSKKNAFPGGLTGGQYTAISDSDAKKIHNASMKVFEISGIQVNDETALKIFHDHGAEVDFKRKIVKADENWVLDKIKTAPSSVKLCGREEKNDLDLTKKKVYIGTGGTATNILDLKTGQRRPSTLNDVQNTAKLVDALNNIHFLVIPCYPNELDKKNVDVNRFYAAIRNTSKHVMGGVYSPEGIKNIANYAAKIAGSKEALLRNPFISFITCIMSPLVMDRDYTEMMITAVETGLPLATPTAPMSGTTAPASLAGTLVQMNVESLSGVILTQLLNPGHPVLYSCVPTTSDLRKGNFCFGSIEMGMMNAACAELSKFYNIPTYVTAGVNESKLPDMQSGYEGMATSLLCCLSGCNYIHDAAGLIDSGMTVSYAQYVADDDILGMCMRAVKGIEVNEKSLAVDVINRVGPGGNYLFDPHVTDYMETEFFYNRVSDRKAYGSWYSEGALDTRQRALERAKKLLETHKPLPIDKTVENEIIKTIPGMVKEWD